MQALLFVFVIAMVLLVAGHVWRRMCEAREARRSEPPGQMCDIGGRRLHVIRRGSGSPAIVLESGGAFSSAMWWPLQERLAATSTAISYDRAGLGWSDPVALPRSIEQRADDLQAMLAHCGVAAPYVMVGISYGGPLIRLFAARHREQVAGMVFVDIAHEAVFSTAGAMAYLRRSSAALRGIARLAQVGVLRALRLRGLSQPATALPYSSSHLAALRSRFRTAHSFAAGADEFASMGRIAQAMNGLGRAGSLGAIPVAVITHGKPFPGPFAVLETNHLQGQCELAALSRNSLFVTAEGSSHGIHVEEPELLLEVIEKVVAAARSGAPLVADQ